MATRNPLVEALPPKTDYITYLTIIEYNLDESQLPVLHELLQDVKLTTNIGWDLVHLLLPLLPGSDQCLQVIARLGNPREVILKVTELLEDIGIEAERIIKKADEHEVESGIESEPLDEARGSLEDRNLLGQVTQVSKHVTQFQSLVQMLCILHPRIRTQRPSRFLEASGRSIIAAYKPLAPSSEATKSVLTFLTSISGSRRPALPPRPIDSSLPSIQSLSIAPDPEDSEAVEDPAESRLILGLLQALVTHTLRLYVEARPGTGHNSAKPWTEQYRKILVPVGDLEDHQSRLELPARTIVFGPQEKLINEITDVACFHLHMDWESLLSIANQAGSLSATSMSVSECSKPGALYLIAAKAVRELFPSKPSVFTATAFSVHKEIVSNFFGFLELTSGSEEGLSIVDAVLTVGWALLNNIGFQFDAEIEIDNEFTGYLHYLSTSAATCASPDMRYEIYLFATKVLHSHPSSKARLFFINDTLQHCPYENIKPVAVGWVKDEFLTALKEKESNATEAAHGNEHDSKVCTTRSNVFSLPKTFRTIAPDLFVAPPLELQLEHIVLKESFYLAVLNLLYLLCTSNPLNSMLKVAEVVNELDLERNFLELLSTGLHKLSASGGTDPDDASSSWEGFMLLEDSLGRAKDAIVTMRRREQGHSNNS